EAATARLLAAAPRAYRLGVDELLLSALVQAAGQGLLVEVEGHGREDLFDDVDLSRTVGWFTTSYPVWLPDGSPIAVKEALRSVPTKGLHWGLLPHDGLPRADIGFNYLGRFDQSVERDGLFSFSKDSGGRSLSADSELDHALEINGSIANGCLSLSWRYSPGVIEPARVEAMLGRFEVELAALVEHCLAAAPKPTASDYPLAGLTQAQFEALDLGEVQDIYPATGLQQGLLYHGLLKQGDGVYVNQLRLTLKGPLDVAALRAAWNDVVARHDILRTGFEWRHGGEALQVVRRSVELPWVEPDEDIAAWCAADLARGFDLSQAPLLRLALFRRPDGDYDLIRTSHHLLSDGWSSARLLAEVSECYRGRAAELPPPVPYRSYVAWARRQPSSEAWWREAMVEDPVGLTASFGAPTKPEPGIHRIEQPLSELGDRLKRAARRRSVTLNTLMQGAWALLLSRFGAKDAVGFGVTVSGRPASLPGVERMLGLFINSLPLWVELPASRKLDAWLQDLQRRNVELRQYEHTPLSDLQRWTGRSGDALFDSLLVFENYPVDEAVGRGEGGLRAGKVEIAERTHYPLTLTISPAPLALDWAWDGERLERGDVELITGHYLDLLDELAREGDPALGAIGLSAPEAVSEPFDYQFVPVHHRLSPSAVVACEGEAIDGPELAAWSRRIGSQLRRLGVQPDELVGLCVERSPGLVAAMLGVWQSGGAYVPLDPGYPAARLADMIADAGLRRVVVDRATAARLAGLLDGLDLVFVDEGTDEDGSEALHPDRLAYVIYTSGSTGKPKGVGVSHGALDRMLMSMAVRPGLTSDDVWLAVTSLSFDIAALELLLPLIVGARLEIARRDSVQDGRRLAALLESSGATVLQATPLGWRLLLEGGWAGRKLKGLCGGEALPSDLAAALHGRGVTLWNMYGPTETTIWSALSLTQPGQPIELGGPIHDTVLRLVDPAGQVVPAGGIGELCIGGANLARGYLGRAGLTAERFVPDPLGQGTRLYRTGDLCRQRADGRLEFLGRLDTQVKLRGHRIELGEVEAQLRTCPGVKAAAAAVRGAQLVGYAVGAVDGEQLKALLASRLPDYLVPSAVLVLDTLPQTPNGKLDRRALPEPAAAARQVVAPRNPVEQALRDIWAQLLRRDDISVGDSFFDLGGDSLGALRLSALAKGRGLGNLTPATVFARPVLAALASYLQVEAAGLPANILPMNSVGMARTLFCLHPGYGLVGEYRALADALEGQVTVYGVQSPIHAEPDWRAADFDALAADYVRRIRLVQPAGPYHLLGWSHGGLVVAAMARR
ncbi:MAG: amino acid adenylation domain-containing protein, partial [Ferrovibrionaceae bacterium]